MVSVCSLMFVVFFKQKTAYEMRISDWSSDVCSSDLDRRGALLVAVAAGDVAQGRQQRPCAAGARGAAGLRPGRRAAPGRAGGAGRLPRRLPRLLLPPGGGGRCRRRDAGDGGAEGLRPGGGLRKRRVSAPVDRKSTRLN